MFGERITAVRKHLNLKDISEGREKYNLFLGHLVECKGGGRKLNLKLSSMMCVVQVTLPLEDLIILKIYLKKGKSKF